MFENGKMLYIIYFLIYKSARTNVMTEMKKNCSSFDKASVVIDFYFFYVGAFLICYFSLYSLDGVNVRKNEVFIYSNVTDLLLS